MANDQYPLPGTPKGLPSLKFQLGKRDRQPSIGVTQGGSSKSTAAAVAGNDGSASKERDLFKPGKGGWGF
jgi:hypothetical protein